MDIGQDSNYFSCIFLRYTSAAQDLVMHSRGKLCEKNWKTADGKPATIDDISVFVIPLAPYKEEYMEWKQEYEAIRGIYENSCETNEEFGKLSLKTSPVATEKAVNRGLATEDMANTGSFHNGTGDSSVSSIPSYNSDIVNNEKICSLSSGGDSGESVTSGDNSSSHYSHEVELRYIPCSLEDTVSNRDKKEEYVPVSTLTLLTDPHTASEVDVLSQPKEALHELSTLTEK